MAATRNTALNAATGDYFSTVDSDDYIDSNMIEVLYATAIDENAEIVISDMYIESLDNTILFEDYLSDRNLFPGAPHVHRLVQKRFNLKSLILDKAVSRKARQERRGDQAILMHSQLVIPAAILSGNPGSNSLKSWMPDKDIRA